jgi:hypothetical protein
MGIKVPLRTGIISTRVSTILMPCSDKQPQKGILRPKDVFLGRITVKELRHTGIDISMSMLCQLDVRGPPALETKPVPVEFFRVSVVLFEIVFDSRRRLV